MTDGDAEVYMEATPQAASGLLSWRAEDGVEEQLPKSAAEGQPWRNARTSFGVALLVAGALLASAACLGLSTLTRPGKLGETGRAVDFGSLEQLSEVDEGHGHVDAIYSFGSPGSSIPALENFQRKDRCFGGLRAYTEDIVGAGSKQVDAAAMSQQYDHAKMPVAVLRWQQDSVYVPCPGKPSWPMGGGVFQDWRLHWEDDYVPRLEHITVYGEDYSSKDPFAAAYQFSQLAYKVYDSTKHIKDVLAGDLPGWKLVAKKTRVTGTGSLYDEDPVLLVQQEATLDCAVVFAGTNNNDNEIATSSQSYSTGYCGFQSVHVGYRNELWSITKDVWPLLVPQLAKCNMVSCVGHGLGGTLCEIFAACANSGRHHDPDYKQQTWIKGTPEAMDAISHGDSALAVGAVKKCEDPPCA